ncbi:MAG: dTDP-4-dehydrorhamnose reductase [Desulfovibrionales bacterium GWA2_65_9]|nr:MAG: dTDP-4-dehydrorhamnose reductase [Desulfovibrionales bacterium GWA2_65_9]
MRLLVTGASGQVGWELARSLMPLGEVVAVDRNECDLARPQDIPALIERIRPDIIVNAAAYTAVDKAEADEEQATLVNGTAVSMLAEAAKKADALLIHYSTDYVFDGTKAAAYTESDEPCPAGAYGRSKLAGEQAIRQSGCDHLILRTSWVFASRGHNFVRTMLRLAQERKELRVIDDQIGAPTWARNIADATAHIIRQAQQERQQHNFDSGVFNLASAGETSWHGFTRAILDGAAQRGLLSPERLPQLHPIPTEAYPLPAPRPKNSRLAGDKLHRRFGITQPSWRDALARCLDEYMEHRGHEGGN